MAQEVARLIDGEFIAPGFARRDNNVVEYRSNEMPDLANAVNHLRETITGSGMTPDDLSVSFTSEEANGKKRTSFSFRAYRR